MNPTPVYRGGKVGKFMRLQGPAGDVPSQRGRRLLDGRK